MIALVGTPDHSVPDAAGASRHVALPKPTTITDNLVDVMRVAILTGEFAPGEHLHQTQLAERYGVSRVPMRDALSRLEAGGLVEIDAHRQARIVTLTLDDVHEIYGIRLLLEPVAARAAVERMTSDDVEDLLRRMDVMQAQAERPVEGLRARRDFYDALYRLSGQPRLHSIIMRTRDEITIYHLTNPASHDSHADLREAIQRLDPDATASFMHAHLLKTRDDLAAELQRRAAGEALAHLRPERHQPT